MLKHFWMISVNHILLQNILKPDRQSCANTAVFRYKDIFNALSCLTDVNLSFALVQARGYQHSTSSFDCYVRDKSRLLSTHSQVDLIRINDKQLTSAKRELLCTSRGFLIQRTSFRINR
jgi:hypothetical protein